LLTCGWKLNSCERIAADYGNPRRGPQNILPFLLRASVPHDGM
jgi:hypothetical protein